jgi:tetratricopeptide (TPR) repeat protein
MPGATDALVYEAKALIHIQDFPGAEDALRRYIRQHPDASGALYLLGFVQHRENQPAESLATYTRAAAIVAPTGDDLKIVGLDYVLLNDCTDAIHWLQRATELEPDNKDAWYYLGRAYYSKGQLGEARNAFLKVLGLSPQDARAENNLGLILETTGQIEDAISAYKKAISWQEKDSAPSSAQPYVNLGGLLLEQGKIQDALEPLEQAVVLAPNDAYCRMKLGVAYRQAGRLPDARRELEKATHLQPDSPIAHYQLGRLYKEMHELNQAQAEFDRTRELQGKAAGLAIDLEPTKGPGR